MRAPHARAVSDWLRLLPALSFGRRKATKATVSESVGRPARFSRDSSGNSSCSGRCIAFPLGLVHGSVAKRIGPEAIRHAQCRRSPYMLSEH